MHKTNKISLQQIAKILYKSIKPTQNVYIHLPFCIKKCHYCAFSVHAIGNNQPDLMNNYLKNLKKQIQFAKGYQNITKSLQSLYFGGGTPSLYSAQEINSLIQYFPVNASTQITVQVNPSEIHKINSYLKKGVNRISLGLQSFNRQTLAKLNRPTSDQTRQEVQEVLMRNRPKNLSVDFIINLCEKQNQWKEMLDFVRNMRPQHLTMYMMQTNPGSKIYQQKKQFQWLSQSDQTISRYQQLTHTLRQMGYDHYQVCNFSLSSQYRSRHSSVYWSGNRQYMAFGMGATSLIQGNRVTRPRTVNKYQKFIDSLGKSSLTSQNLQINQEKDPKSILNSVLMSGIRTKQGITWKKIQEISPEYDLKTYFLRELEKIQSQKTDLIDWSKIDQKIVLKSPLGFLLADLIAYKLVQIMDKTMK